MLATYRQPVGEFTMRGATVMPTKYVQVDLYYGLRPRARVSTQKVIKDSCFKSMLLYLNTIYRYKGH